MLKILVVGMTENPGGIESVVMNYFRNADSNKLHFDFLSTFPHMAYESEILGAGSSIVSLPSRHAKPITFGRRLDFFMKEHATEYDAIWVNLCNLVNIDFLKAAKRHGIARRIIHCHNSQNMEGPLKNMVHAIHRGRITEYATDFWTCSEEATPWFYGESIRSNPAYAYIPNAIDPEEVRFDRERRDTVRKEMGWEGKKVLGNVARLHPQKNQSFLLESLAPLLKKDSTFQLVLVGDGILRDDLQQQAEELEIRHKVEFLGLRADVKDLYQGMDVFLLPSEYEGVSMSFLEAQANGLPCLISDTLSDEGIVNGSVQKLPIDASGAQAWRSAVQDLSSDNSMRGLTALRGSAYDIHVQVQNLQSRLSQKS